MIRFKFKKASSNGEPASAKAKEANHDRDQNHGSYIFRICRLFLSSLASPVNIRTASPPPPPAPFVPQKGPAFARFSAEDVVRTAAQHPVPCSLSLSLLFFMAVEYTLGMVPASSAPVDVGFVLTRPLHGLLVGRPNLSSSLAALNTVFVGMQIMYIVWTFLVEGRPRPTIAALFMFTCRGILGYSTRLPLPEGFLGSGVDFPVGNVSFFLFFSGHVGGSVIASQDMRRARRRGLARTFDVLNLLQVVRLLATRGHYTIDLAAGLGAGFLSDVLAGNYEEWKEHRAAAGKL